MFKESHITNKILSPEIVILNYSATSNSKAAK